MSVRTNTLCAFIVVAEQGLAGSPAASEHVGTARGRTEQLTKGGGVQSPSGMLLLLPPYLYEYFWGISSLSQEDRGLQESWGGILYQGL